VWQGNVTKNELMTPDIFYTGEILLTLSCTVGSTKVSRALLAKTMSNKSSWTFFIRVKFF